MHRIELAAGSRTVPLKHPMEAVYYVMQRRRHRARSRTTAAANPLIEGSMIHVEPGTAYLFEAGGAGIALLGGPCPADPALYRKAG